MTITYNAALVRWQGGHLYVDRSGSARQRELYIEMGGVADEDTARGIANQILGLYREARRTLAVQGQVRTVQQIPTVGYQLADRMTGAMLRSYTVSLDGDGLVAVTPEVDDPLQIRLAAINRQLQRAAAGAKSEYARPNIVSQDTSSGTDTEPPEFSLSGALTPGFSPAWRAGRPWWCSWLDVNLVAPGATATRVDVIREAGPSWSTVATATIPAGLSRGLAVVNEGWAAGQRLVIVCRTAGAGASDLTATLRGTMV